MPCRIRHVVPAVLALAVLAGPAQASEPVLIRSGPGATPMVLAEDEIQLVGAKGASTIPGIAAVSTSGRASLLGSSRAALQAAARNLLAAGAASDALPVLYLNGNRGDRGSRVLASRQILVETKDAGTIATIAHDHGLRVVEPAPGIANAWMAEPESRDFLAALDAAEAMLADQRVRSAQSVLMMPIASRGIPNDPLVAPVPIPPGPTPPNVVPNTPAIEGQWHLDDNEPAGLHVKPVWAAGYTGVGACINLVDGGVEVSHEDLQGNINTTYSRDYLRNSPQPLPEHRYDYHGTAMAGLISGVGDNGMGISGVAWSSKLFVSKVVPAIFQQEMDRRSILGANPTPDTRLAAAMSSQLSAANLNLRTWALVCAWGPVDNGQNTYAPGSLIVQAERDAGSLGRGGYGSPIFWAVGNGGHDNPNITWGDPTWDGVIDEIFGYLYSNITYQDTAGFDGYLNRYTIPVASHERDYAKALYSEYGPNIICSAPGGGTRSPTTIGLPGGLCTTDLTDPWLGPWTGLVGWMTDLNTTVTYELIARFSESGSWWARNSCNFDRNDTVETDGMDDNQTPGWPGLPIPPLPSDPLVVDQRGVPQAPFPDPHIRYKDPDVLSYENGCYVPPKQALAGTSYAAALAAGTGTVMMQARPDLHWRDVRSLLIQRCQDKTALTPFPLTNRPHDLWGWWLPNKNNLVYNGRYGYGGIDANSLVNGGNAGGVQEPGALDWPLMPALLSTPVTASYTYTLNEANASVINWVGPPTVLGATNPPAVDSLPAAPAQVPFNFWTRAPLTIDPVQVPDRFRVEVVEVDVELTTPGTGGTANWGDWNFQLVSPAVDLVAAPPLKQYGTTCQLMRQRPGGLINQNATWKWTFTEFVHYSEPAYTANPPVGTTTSAGTPIDQAWYRQWQLLIQDEKFDNEGQLRKVDLRLYGFQTYPNPTIGSLSPTGVAIGEENTIYVTGGGFASSAGNVNVTQGYWASSNLTAATAATPVTSIRGSGGSLALSIPSSLVPASPATGSVWIANPAIPLGRSSVSIPPYTPTTEAQAAVPTDEFDRNDDGTLATVMLSPRPAGQAHMKVCPAKVDVKYSHRPTLSPISDIVFQKGGGSINVTTYADDVDVQAGLPASAPESLSVSVASLNPYVVVNPISFTSQPGGNGIGNYSFNVTSSANSGLALMQVTATDGVLTATRTFRVVILSDKDGSGCGGGMGLALLGIPLVAWLLRRRRK